MQTVIIKPRGLCSQALLEPARWSIQQTTTSMAPIILILGLCSPTCLLRLISPSVNPSNSNLSSSHVRCPLSHRGNIHISLRVSSDSSCMALPHLNYSCHNTKEITQFITDCNGQYVFSHGLPSIVDKLPAQLSLVREHRGGGIVTLFTEVRHELVVKSFNASGRMRERDIDGWRLEETGA